MICPPCTIQSAPGYDAVLYYTAAGTLILLAVTCALKSYDYVLSIRERRIRTLHAHGGLTG